MSEDSLPPAAAELLAEVRKRDRARLMEAVMRVNGTYVAMVDRMAREAEAYANGKVEG